MSFRSTPVIDHFRACFMGLPPEADYPDRMLDWSMQYININEAMGVK